MWRFVFVVAVVAIVVETAQSEEGVVIIGGIKLVMQIVIGGYYGERRMREDKIQVSVLVFLLRAHPKPHTLIRFLVLSMVITIKKKSKGILFYTLCLTVSQFLNFRLFFPVSFSLFFCSLHYYYSLLFSFSVEF